MRIAVATAPEAEAYLLVYPTIHNEILTHDLRGHITKNECCDYVIALAERIKSSRAVSAMHFAAMSATAHPQESNEPREQQPQGQQPSGHKQEDAL